MKKKTTEEFKQEVYDLVGTEYTVTGEYKNALTKIKIKHNKCEYEYEIIPYSFRAGARCPKCSNHIKGTTESFKQEVYDLVGAEYTVTGEYINNNTKIEMQHNVCEHKYEVTPNSFKHGIRCPFCSNHIKKTTESFKQEVYDLVGTEYTVTGEYKNTNTKIEMQHNVCGHKYEVTPSNFKRGRRCPKCSNHIKGTTESFKQEVYDLVGAEYTVTGEYKDANTKIEMQHNVCGHKYEVVPNSFRKGHRCPKCYGYTKKTTEEFKQEVYDLVGAEYTVTGEYKNTNTKIEMQHNVCGHKYEVTPSNFKRGNRCPFCSNHIKKTAEEFKQEVYDLVGAEYTVTGEYKDTKTKIEMQHNVCGHKYEVTPSDFKCGSRCPKCYGNIKGTTESFKQEVYDLVGTEYTVTGEYINNNTKIEMQHNVCGCRFKVTPYNFKVAFNKCPSCYHKNKKVHNKKNIDIFKQEVYDLVGPEYSVIGEEYKSVNAKIEMKHNVCGHKYEVTPSNFKRGRRCPFCSKTKHFSNDEKEILDFIKSFYDGKVQENDRTILGSNRELDIYIPDKKLAIEFNGIYWHSELNGKNKDYHLRKTIKCESKGIKLLHIFEDEWNNKKDIVKKIIKHCLNYYPEIKIKSSNCYISEISEEFKTNFLKENSIESDNKSTINLGLWYPLNNDEQILVAVMTFYKTNKNTYKITNFVTNLDFYIEDSFNSLFNYFKDNYKFKMIDAYIDRRWNINNDYKNNNFILEETTEPKCFYIKTNRCIMNRFIDVSNEENYAKIWDCGQLHYIYQQVS